MKITMKAEFFGGSSFPRNRLDSTVEHKIENASSLDDVLEDIAYFLRGAGFPVRFFEELIRYNGKEDVLLSKEEYQELGERIANLENLCTLADSLLFSVRGQESDEWMQKYNRFFELYDELIRREAWDDTQ